MTDSKYTHIALLSDRSGSMEKIQSDAQGGINSLIADQRKTTEAIGGRCTISLLEFDNYASTVYTFSNILNVPDPAYHLVPRGSTALRDSMAALIRTTGQQLAALPEDVRPGVVLFVVMTDGLENASFLTSSYELRQLVQEHQTKYGWQFIFLGANQDAFAVGQEYGFLRSATINFNATPEGTQNVYGSTSGLMSSARVATASAGVPVAFAGYSEDDRDGATK
jgi:uncharacterized protein YegL